MSTIKDDMDSETRMPEYIRCGSFDSDENVKYHDHPGTELVYVTAGKCDIAVSGLNLSGQTGTLFVLPAGISHNQINLTRVGTRYVIFRNSARFDDRPRTLELAHDAWIGHWLDDIFALQIETHDSLKALCSGLLFLVLRRIAELEATGQRRTAYPPALLRAVAYVEENFTKALTLNDIAVRAGICPEYLCGMFKKHMQRSPVSYLLELRLKYARRLLDDRYLSIKDISGQCGFNDVNYFCRRFRQYFGCSPGEMRSAAGGFQNFAPPANGTPAFSGEKGSGPSWGSALPGGKTRAFHLRDHQPHSA